MTKDHNCGNILKNLINSDEYGMLIHDRFVNMPLQLIYHLHRNLLDDFLWITNKKENKTGADPTVVKQFEQLKNLVIFCPCSDDGSTARTSSVNNDKGTLEIENVLGSSSVMLHYFEDDIFFENAEEAYKLKISTKLFKASNYVIMVMPVARISKVVEGLKLLVNC